MITAPPTYTERLLLFSKVDKFHSTIHQLIKNAQQQQAFRSDSIAEDTHPFLWNLRQDLQGQVDFVSQTEQLLTCIQQANVEGNPYFALVFDAQGAADIPLLDSLLSSFPALEIYVCLDMMLWFQWQQIAHLFQHPNIFFLRKPLVWYDFFYLLLSRSHQRQREQERWRQESRYALAMRGSNDGVWDWNLRTNEFYLSQRGKEMLGYSEHEFPNTFQEWLQRIHSDDRGLVRNKLIDHIQGGSPFFEMEYRVQMQGDMDRWILARGRRVRENTGHEHRIIGTQTDITSYKKLEEKQLYDAFHDPLTRLPNRALFLDRLEFSRLRSRRTQDHNFSVLVLDLDRFGMINESLGHTMGDELLRQIAMRLRNLINPTDTLARLGGDEFAVLLDEESSMARASRVAERIQQVIAVPFNLEGRDVFTNVSIGISSSKRDYERAEDILRDAESAMTTAKAQGKSRVELFVTDMHIQAVTLLQLETDLRRALERDELRVVYQPIVALHDGQIIGFEALVRWEKSPECWIPPSSFIPVAEEADLIIPIGRWVFEMACRQMQRWKEIFFEDVPLTINVNISTKQLADPTLVGQIKEALEETGVEGHHIKLEVTESVLMDNESARDVFLELQQLGIKLCMDDFGTGYSSLSYLHRFPFDTLKIDRSFVNRLQDRQNAEIVRTVISLAQTLNMNVVAEGVETTRQLAELRRLNCEFGQGYLFSKPINSQQATQLLTRRELPEGA